MKKNIISKFFCAAMIAFIAQSMAVAQGAGKSSDAFIDFSNFSNSRFGGKFDDTKGKYEFSGVEFGIVNPNRNKNRSSIMFRTKSESGVTEVPLKLSGKNISGKFLYILHSSINPTKSGDKEVGQISLSFADGKTEVLKVVQGDNISWRFNPAETSNAKIVYSSDADKKFNLIYMARFELPSESKIESMTLATSLIHKWEVFAITVSDKNVATTNAATPIPGEWTKADIPKEIAVIKGSALDLSKFTGGNEAAGEFGRVIVSKRGTLAFEKKPDEDARFRGFTDYPHKFLLEHDSDLRQKNCKEYAQAHRLYGYNCVRPQFDFIKGRKYRARKTELFDRLDFYFAELKKAGVYVCLPLMWYDSGEENYVWELHDDVKIRTVYGDPTAIACWKATAEEQLNHVNPYTGLAWKDDPMFMMMEYYNELSICFNRMDISPQSTKDFVMGEFRKWLKKKYNNNVKAYDGGSYKSFDDIKKADYNSEDWLRFSWEKKIQFVEMAEKFVKDLGYKGIVAQTNLQSSPIGNDCRSRFSDIVIKNSYFSHPSGFEYTNVSCTQNSSLASTYYWLGIASSRDADRPIGMTEYTHCFWNKYRYEAPIVVPAYSAFQNFSYLIIHSDAVAIPSVKYRNFMEPFQVAVSPIIRVAEVFTACFFMRGDVKPAKSRVDLKFSREYIEKNPLAVRGISVDQSRISLMTGFATVCENPKRENLKKVKVKPAEITISPQGSSEIRSEAWFQEMTASTGKNDFNLPKFVETLREKKILPADNITDATMGIYQSETGQIILNTSGKYMTVITPKSEMIALEGGEDVQLGSLKVISSSESASIGVCSLDNKRITKSKRLLLAYCTREGNEGMVLSPDLKDAKTLGKAPILLKNGILKAEVKLDINRQYALYPLALNGLRREKIPAEFIDGILKINIDTSKLPDGATTMFEIVGE